MKTAFCMFILLASASAQETAPVTKLIELNNVSGRAIENLLGGYDVQVRLGSDPRFLTLRGRREGVESAEQAIRLLDRLKKNIEINCQIVGKTPLESLQIRTREGTGADATSNIQPREDGAPNGMFIVHFNNASLNLNEKVVRLDGMRFIVKMPVAQKNGSFQFTESNLMTDIDLRQGQAATIGRVNLGGNDGTYSLVVNVKVLD